MEFNLKISIINFQIHSSAEEFYQTASTPVIVMSAPKLTKISAIIIAFYKIDSQGRESKFKMQIIIIMT